MKGNKLFNEAEFRLETPGVRWEDCEVVDTIFDTTRRDADKRAQDLASFYGLQCRWNWVGGNNGHYFGGSDDR